MTSPKQQAFIFPMAGLSLLLGMLFSGCSEDLKLTAIQGLPCPERPESKYCQDLEEKELKSLNTLKIERFAIKPDKKLTISWTAADEAQIVKKASAILSKDRDCKSEEAIVWRESLAGVESLQDVPEGIYYVCLSAKTTLGTKVAAVNNGQRLVVDFSKPDIVASPEIIANSNGDLASDLKIIDISNVSLSWQLVDDGSGAELEALDTMTPRLVGAKAGTYTVILTVTDEGGNTSSKTFQIISGKNTADPLKKLTAPTAIQVAAYSKTPNVSASYTPGMAENFITHNVKACSSNDCSTGCSNAIPDEQSPVEITALVNGSSYFICMQSVDTEGNSSIYAASSNSVTIDTTNPSAPTSPGFAATYSASTTAIVSFGASTDTNFSTHEGKVCASNDCSTGCLSTVQSVTSPISLSGLNNGSAYYGCVRGLDLAGNASAFVASVLTVTIDTTAPTGTIALSQSGGYASTQSPAITLSRDADVTHYQLCSNAATTGSSCTGLLRAFTAYAASPAAYNFGSDGAKTLYVQYRDSAGNIGATVASNTLTVDTLLPAAPSSPSFSGTDSASTSPSLAFTVSTDSNFSSHDASACTNSDCLTGCLGTVTSIGSPVSLTGLTHGQTYYGCVRGRDLAGNTSAYVASAATIRIDTIAPGNPTAVSVPSSTTGNFNISFTAGTEANPGNFNMRACTDSGCSVGCVGAATTAASPGTIAAAALSNGTTYYGCVQGTDLAGNSSSWVASAWTVGFSQRTVTYNSNTSSGGSVPTDAKVYTTGQLVTVLGNTGALVKTGQLFAGWNTAADGSGSNYLPANTFAIGPANVTLYAQWIIDCLDLTGIWVGVRGDSTYGTNDFCVMKYEAKDVGGVATSVAAGSPWVSITQIEAQTACQNLGSNVHLITNNEWMSLASNIASTRDNWSGGTVGSGAMNQGHSDASPNSACAASSDDSSAYVEGICTPLTSGSWSQKRTHTLSTGAVIWDVAGNVWNLTSYVIPNNNTKPFVSGDGGPLTVYRELSAVDSGFRAMSLNALRPINLEKSFWNDSWNSTQGIGQYRPGSNGSGGTLIRGARFSHGSLTGIFAASLDDSPTTSNSNIGFRCARSTYKVTYNGNANTGGIAPTDATVYSAGNTVTVLTNTGSLMRPGYIFAGWNTAADGSGTTYAGGATFAVATSNTTLYAKWTLDCSDLPGSWVVVPGDSVYGTSDFCAMKFEAKNVGGIARSEAAGPPWVNITQTAAQTACQSLGSNVHLITNNEWMSLATNIASIGGNWSDSIVGSGSMNRGHSDNSPGSACAASPDDSFAYVEGSCTPLNSGDFDQKRTHTLSTGAVIWDLAGNAADWTSLVISDSAKPFVSADGSPQAAIRELSAVNAGFTAMTLHDLRPINSEKSFWSDSWNSTQGVGRYWSGPIGSGGSLQRGGSWGYGSWAGVFYADLSDGAFYSDIDFGFRCTRATYKVTYSANVSSAGSVPTDANVYSMGQAATVLANTGSLTRTGLVFAGWNTAANGSGTNYSPGNSLTLTTSNVTLYARWALPCTELPGSWVLVPGDSVYGTADTCVMKFEAKNVGSVATSEAAGTPWVNISQTAAQTACQNVAANVRLITNNEWMALASNIANVNSNWSGGTVGVGAMNIGHSDNSPAAACEASTLDSDAYVEANCMPMSTGSWSQKRTHTLNTGAVIWDFAGNVWDWTSYVIADNNAKPYVSSDLADNSKQLSAINAGFTVMSLKELRPVNSEKSFWNDAWNTSQGAGMYYYSGMGYGGALQRGGYVDWLDANGVFAAALHNSPSSTESQVGFRCARLASP